LILYLDTSSLVKVYLEEEGSAQVRSTAEDALKLATSRVAYSEFRAMLARSRRSGRIGDADFASIRSRFEIDWGEMLILDVTDHLVRLAGDLADQQNLRGFDAIHLASALETREVSSSEVKFSTADRHLRDAAASEGFVVVP
jgi:predicted nucleic acid-binding protein